MKNKRNPIDQIEFMRSLLAFGLVGAFIGAMAVFTFFVIPATNKDILTYMVGQLSGMAIMALGFYFVNKVGQDALDAAKTENSGKAFDAITATVKASGTTDAAADAAEATAGAAVDKAEEIKGDL